MWEKIFFQLIILMGELDPGLLTQSIQKYLALVHACVCCVCCTLPAGFPSAGNCTISHSVRNTPQCSDPLNPRTLTLAFLSFFIFVCLSLQGLDRTPAQEVKEKEETQAPRQRRT